MRAALALVLSAAAGTQTNAAAPRVFTEWDRGAWKWGVWVWDLAKGSATELADGQAYTTGWYGRYLAICPDGSGAYLTDLRFGGLRIARLGGRPPTELLVRPELRPDNPLPSPDGRHLAYTRWTEAHPFGLWLLDLQTRQETALAERMAFPQTWTPDGQWVVFKQEDSLWRVDLSGRRTEQLTHGPAGSLTSDSYATCSRLGDLAFERDVEVWVLRHGAAQEERLASLPAWGPLWSPDGRRLVVCTDERVSDNEVRQQLDVVGLDGTRRPLVQVVVPRGATEGMLPALTAVGWLNDRTFVIGRRPGMGQDPLKLYTVDLATGERRFLLKLRPRESEPTLWVPPANG